MGSLNVRPITVLGAISMACAIAVATSLALAGVNVVSTGSGKSVSRVIARGGTGVQSFTSSSSFQNVVGARATVKVPAGRQALITARFTASSRCTGSGGKGGPWCSVRILIGGTEANPASTENYEFDSSDAGNEGPYSWEGHAMERFRTVGPGKHVVKVQAIPMNGATDFSLGDWSLVVQRSLK